MATKFRPAFLEWLRSTTGCGDSATSTTATTTATSTNSNPSTPVKTAVRWAAKRLPNPGVVMVADVENQKTPLMASMELHILEATTVNGVIEKDDDAGVRRLVQEWGGNAVWRPPPHSSQGAHIMNSFHVSARKGALKALKALLESSPPKEVFDAPDHDGKTPLMIAVAEAQLEAAKLLISAGANVNSRNGSGLSALHTLAFTISRGSKPMDALLEIADLLLACPDIDLEPHSDSHLTPLATAAEKIPQSDKAPKTGGLIDFCRKLVNKGASMTANAKSGTIEEVLQSKQAYTPILMGRELRQPPPRPSSSEFLDMIILGNSLENIKEFLRKKNTDDARAAVNSKLGSESLLFRAIDRVDRPLVEVLLKAGANPWAFEITQELPIHRAAARGHFDIFNLIIEKMKGEKKTVDIQDYSFSIIKKIMESSKKQRETSVSISHSKCLSRLMEKDVIMNYNQEWMDQTVLHVAASFNNQEAMSELIQHGAFLGARRKVLGKDCGNILPYLLPTTMERAMDGCISYHPLNPDASEAENVVNDDYTLKLDYRFLVPPVNTDVKQEARKINELETLMEINKNKRHRPMIKHPLIQALLYAKWRKALPLYIINVSIYFLFIVLLTGFVYTMKDLRILEEKVNNTSNAAPSSSELNEDIDSLQSTVHILMAFLLPLTFYMLIREIMQIVLTYKTYYKNIENYLEWFLVLVVFILCIAPLDADVTRHLAAWAMIVAWYEFVLILGRAPPLAIYITMLRHVSWNFVKFICLYGALILAFTISFNIILQPTSSSENSDFSNFWSTLPKAIVMATGEFEYSDLNDQFSNKVIFLHSALLVFLLFLFLIFLVLMNVMNGLAVTDTQQVVDDAILYSLTSRLELVYLTESLFLNCPGLKSFVSRIHLLSGDMNQAILYARVNRPDKNKRLAYGKNSESFQDCSFSKLDNKTADCLRSHRLQRLEEEEKERRGDSMSQCLSILQELQDLATIHPQVIQQASATLQSRQANRN